MLFIQLTYIRLNLFDHIGKNKPWHQTGPRLNSEGSLRYDSLCRCYDCRCYRKIRQFDTVMQHYISEVIDPYLPRKFFCPGIAAEVSEMVVDDVAHPVSSITRMHVHKLTAFNTDFIAMNQLTTHGLRVVVGRVQFASTFVFYYHSKWC